MATSQITIYKTKLTPERNGYLDQFDYYLSSRMDKVYTECQYQKIALDLTVKIVLDQKYSFGVDSYNYCRIDQDEKSYFYFIINSKWKAQNTVELILSMDTVATTWSFLNWSANTKITRQHKDRFNQKNFQTLTKSLLTRHIDRSSEGINGTKIFVEKEKVYQNSLPDSLKDTKWYLIYRTSDNLSVDNISNPIDCFCIADKTIDLNVSPSPKLLDATNFAAYDMLVISSSDNPAFSATVNGNTYNVGVSATYDTLIAWRRVGGTGSFTFKFYNRTTSASVEEVAQSATITEVLKAHYMVVGQTEWLDNQGDKKYWLSKVFVSQPSVQILGQNASLLTIDQIDRTDSKIMKVIELPYAPFSPTFLLAKMNVPTGWSISGGMLKLDNLSSTFQSSVGSVNLQDVTNLSVLNSELSYSTTHDIKYESKLYHSDFFNKTFKYDSFTKDILYEYAYRVGETYDGTASTSLDVNFVPTNTVNSNFLFDVYSDNCLQELTSDSRYINVRRNNEISLYNNDFVQYIRTGYNYEKKVNERNFALGLTSSAIGATSGILSGLVAKGGFGIATGISIGSSAISGLVGAISNRIAGEESIQQKLNQLSYSPSSVSGADDIDLLNYMNGNKAEVITSSVSNELKNDVYNLLRITGYSCSDYGVPNFNTRIWYNFVQCEAVFNNEESLPFPKEVIEDVKARFRVGVTVYHRNPGAGLQYDFDQARENFENWLLE